MNPFLALLFDQKEFRKVPQTTREGSHTQTLYRQRIREFVIHQHRYRHQMLILSREVKEVLNSLYLLVYDSSYWA